MTQVVLLLEEDRSWRVLAWTILFHISPKHQLLPIVKQRIPKGKAEALLDIYANAILGN